MNKKPKAPTTRAGKYVREEMHHMREHKHPKHPIKSRKQAIAVGLSKARKAGIPVKKKSAKA